MKAWRHRKLLTADPSLPEQQMSEPLKVPFQSRIPSGSEPPASSQSGLVTEAWLLQPDYSLKGRFSSSPEVQWDLLPLKMLSSLPVKLMIIFLLL